MGHAIDRTTGKAAMMYVRKEGAPWHSLGQAVEEAATWMEAREQAVLNWLAIKSPLFYTGPDGAQVQIRDRFAMIRSDTGHYLATVSERYQPVQNDDCFRFLDSLVGSGELRYHTAGALHGGRTIWLLTKLPETVRVVGDDAVDLYLLLTNSHDGTSAMRVLFTPTRVVCQNTLSMALSSADRRGRTGWSFHHTGDLQKKIAEARMLLGLASEEFERFGDGARLLARASLTEAQLKGYFERLYPDPIGEADDPKVEVKRVEQRTHRDRLRELFDTGVGLDMPGVRGTAWAAYNAFAEHLDHDRPHRARNRRSVTQFEHSVFGAGRGHKARAFDLALELAGA